MSIYLLLALIAAVAYSIASLINKQAIANGCGVLRVMVFTIWATALLLIPFALSNSDPLPWNLWHQPLIAAVCFSGGSLFFIWSLKVGDLSVVAPVSGVKPVMNALLIAGLLRSPIPLATWGACALSALALLVLRTPNTTTHHSFLRTAVITLMSSLFFALCDTCFQQWASGWGVFRFGAITFSISALASFSLIPFFSTPWKKISRSAKQHILIGAAICALPGLCMTYALGNYGHAAELNVVYNTRAIISILAVRFLGRFVGSTEHTAGGTILLRRLAGAIILMGAIILIIF